MNDESNKSPRRILIKTDTKTKIHEKQFNYDVLIVASKMKKYIKDKHGLNTSGDVCDKLSDIVRVAADRAIDNAMKDGRKTLMAKDF